MSKRHSLGTSRGPRYFGAILLFPRKGLDQWIVTKYFHVRNARIWLSPFPLLRTLSHLELSSKVFQNKSLKLPERTRSYSA